MRKSQYTTDAPLRGANIKKSYVCMARMINLMCNYVTNYATYKWQPWHKVREVHRGEVQGTK